MIRLGFLRPVSLLLCFAAAILTLIGSFLTLFSAEWFFSESLSGSSARGLSIKITSWEALTEPPDNGGFDVPLNGIPLVIAAVAMLLAAVFGMLASAAPGNLPMRRRAAMTVAVGTAFLTATVLGVVVQGLSWRQAWTGPAEESNPQLRVDAGFGAGLWLLVGAAVIAMAASGVLWRATRPAPDRVEPDTPSLGIPAVVVHRLPDEPQEAP
jgi:hypothetical protein